MSDITLGRADDTYVFARGRGTLDRITDFGSTYFSTFFTGALVVPAVSNPANGNGEFVLNMLHTRLDVSMDINGVDFNGKQTADAGDNVIGLSFHRGDRGANGPVVWGIIGPDNDTNNDTAINPGTGEVTSSWDKTEGKGASRLTAQIPSLLAGQIYVDIITNDAESGAARGQIMKLDDGADRIDLTNANIGDFSTLQQIMHNVSGAATMVVRADGQVYGLALDGILVSQLKASDFIFAPSANETITGTNNAEDIFGAGGNDKILALLGNDRVYGESGNDSINLGAGADAGSGGLGSDVISGDAGNDILAGNEGNDVLSGAAGNDSIVGGAGNDQINMGQGSDIALGSAGADIFAFTTADWGGDGVRDFEDGLDKLRFKRAIADNVTDFVITGNHTANITLTIGAENLHLHSAHVISITAADLLFIA